MTTLKHEHEHEHSWVIEEDTKLEICKWCKEYKPKHVKANLVAELDMDDLTIPDQEERY